MKPAARSSARPGWWSDADDAELDVLLDAFVGAVQDHRERCAVCSAGGPWCDSLRDGLAMVLDFKRTRSRRSLATWLRARQELRDAAVAA